MKGIIYMFFKKFWKKSPPSIKDIPKEQQSSQNHLSVIIQDFWRQVKKSEQSLNELELIDIIKNINKLLDENQLDVIAEITIGDIKKHKIIFTADGKIDRFEYVMEITRQAPDLQFFEVEAFRQRTNNVDTFVIKSEESSFSLSATDLLIQYKESYRKISIGILFAKTIPEDMVKQAETMALIYLDHLLGEYDFAVRLESIEFLKTDHNAVTIPANQFVTIFDRLWKEDLKHTGVLNVQEDQWIVFELTDLKILVHRNEAANSLVGHENYCYALNIIVDIDSKEALSLVYELEDTINLALRADEQGIHCQNSFSQGVRNMLWHVGNKHSALQLVQQITDRYHTLSVKTECEFDPFWRQYLRWVECHQA
jgi:hypothetical protein